MPRSILLTLAAILLGVTAPFTAGQETRQDGPPPVFDRRPYAEARKAAEAGKKWFLVKATAIWCGPCKQMDKTTWRDAAVVQWLTRNAIVVALDVDQEPGLAEKLGIASMPTMIAFKDGDTEFDRVVGYKQPTEFLTWLEGIAKGEKSIEAVRKRAGDRADPKGTVDVNARMELARALVQEGKFEEAADEFSWLWQHMLEHQPSMSGVRLSFMVSDMQQLAARSPEAKKKLVALRDRTGERIDGEKVAADDMVDWVHLNKILGESAASLAWLDKVKDKPRFRPLIDRVARELAELLVAAKRWADLGTIYPDPTAELEREHEFLGVLAAMRREVPGDFDEETRRRIQEMPVNSFREKAGLIYAGLLAAAREPLAETFAGRARELDASPKMLVALVSTALTAGQPRKQHLQWLDAAPKTEKTETTGKTGNKDTTERAIRDLRGRLEAALGRTEKQ